MMSENMINRTRSTSKLILYYILIIMYCYMLPMIKYSLPYVIMAFFLLITYLFCIYKGRIRIDPCVITIVCSCILGFLTILVTHPLNFTEGINEMIRSLRFIAPALLFLFLEGDGKPNLSYMRIVSIAAFFLFGFVAVQTLIALQTNPMLARILAYGIGIDEQMAAYRFQNVGGFEFSYSVGFIAIVALYLSLSAKKKLYKIIWLAVYGFALFYVIQVQYMTLLILTIVFSVVLIYQLSKHTLFGFLIAVFTVIALLSIPTVIDYLSQNASGDMLAYKFGTFKEFFENGDISAIGKRPRYLLEALGRFFESPLWGHTISENGKIFQEFNEVHSTFFGYLQNMGLIGFCGFYIPFFLVGKHILNTLQSKQNKNCYRTILLMLLVLSILNPINYCFEVCFTVFLIVPCILKNIDI